MSTHKTNLRMVSDALAAKVSWFDDFLGIEIDGAYKTSLLGDGLVRIRATGSVGVSSTGPFGGWLQLVAPGPDEAVARLRLGADPPDDSGTEQFLPFNGAKNTIFETRCFLSNVTAGEFLCTIGLIAFEDPDNILGVLYYNGSGWFLQTAEGAAVTNVAISGFTPSAFGIFTLRIETSSSLVSLYINDVLKAQSTTNIPEAVGAAPEFQLWNQDVSGWTSIEMAADYLLIRQDR